MYNSRVPRLWTETIETHRQTVREATLDAAARLLAEHGLRGVTMSQIAEQTGVGRATLYKYFPDVEAILLAWHHREIARHLAMLVEARDAAADAGARLEAVLGAYGRIARQSRRHHDAELATLLHRDAQVVHAEHELRRLVHELLVDAVSVGIVRDDVAPDELVEFSLQALAAASRLPSEAAVGRLVTIVLAGLRRPQSGGMDTSRPVR
jgi:AcrR family transcriptional regulator